MRKRVKQGLQVAAAAALLGTSSIGVTAAMAEGEKRPSAVESSRLPAQLPHRVHWLAAPSLPQTQMAEELLMIDGKAGRVGHHARYGYGLEGNYLVASLKPDLQSGVDHLRGLSLRYRTSHSNLLAGARPNVGHARTARVRGTVFPIEGKPWSEQQVNPTQCVMTANFVDWGDGVKVNYRDVPVGGTYTVGPHIYQRAPGPYDGFTSTTGVCPDPRDNATNESLLHVEVIDAALHMTAELKLPDAGAGSIFGKLAHFTDEDPGARADYYKSNIWWGDGKIDQDAGGNGIIVAASGGFDVFGSHKYDSPDHLPPTIVVRDATTSASVTFGATPPFSLKEKVDFAAKETAARRSSALACGSRPSPETKFASPINKLLVFVPGLGQYCAFLLLQARHYAALANDPPDPAATQIAQPAPIDLMPSEFHIDPNAIDLQYLCSRVAFRDCTLAMTAYRRWQAFLRSLARAEGIAGALETTQNRVSGSALLIPESGRVAATAARKMQVAAAKVYSGQLANSLAGQRAAGRRLAAILKTAHVNLELSRATVAARLEALKSFSGLDSEIIRLLDANGTTPEQLAAILSGPTSSHAVDLRANLSASTRTDLLARLYHSLRVPDLVTLEEGLHAGGFITDGTHKILGRDLALAAAAHGRAQRAVLRSFGKHAAAARGGYAAFLRSAAAGVGT